MSIRHALCLSVGALATVAACDTSPERVKLDVPVAGMSFFLTSEGMGNGADLNGLAGADRHCQTLAEEVGAGDQTWRAYLSATPVDGAPGVNARDRIGSGPWINARGQMIASSLVDLHGSAEGLNKETALTEHGSIVNGRGDQPNMHDILTGSTGDGRALVADGDTTCRNWTHSGEGGAQVGHHDRQGGRPEASATSWNSSHLSRGCSQEALESSGGAGKFYCFAAD